MKSNKHTKVIGNVRDRGALKWQGMLLTEHVRLMRDWREEQDAIPKPELDEYDLELLHEELSIALKRRCLVRIQSWRDKRYNYDEGIIESINTRTRALRYEGSEGRRNLSIDEIVSVTLLE